MVIPFCPSVGPRDGMKRKCVVNADDVLTIPKRWLEARIAPLRPEKVEQLDQALRFALALGLADLARGAWSSWSGGGGRAR